MTFFSKGLLLLCNPDMRKQFFDSVDGMVINDGQDIFQPDVRVDIMQLTGAY
jgi:hypothetical protein